MADALIRVAGYRECTLDEYCQARRQIDAEERRVTSDLPPDDTRELGQREQDRPDLD